MSNEQRYKEALESIASQCSLSDVRCVHMEAAEALGWEWRIRNGTGRYVRPE